MLWQRWGTPTAEESGFSSGFEEEFSIARARREQGDSPEIWIFFKEVEQSRVADPGPQLQRVLAFRESLAAGRALLFREFASVDAWERTLRNCLLRHVLDVAKPTSNGPEGPGEKKAAAADGVTQTAGASAGGRQIAELAQALAPSFESGDIHKVATALNDSDQLAFLAVRSLLLSAALVDISGTDSSPLPVHELNTLYRYRSRLDATFSEAQILLKSLLGDAQNLRPGWFWFKDDDVEEATLRLAVIAVSGNDTPSRARSFDILRHAHSSIFEVQDRFLQPSLQKMPADLYDAAWAHIVEVATAEDLDLLRRWAPGTWFEARVPWLEAWVDSGGKLDAFLAKHPDASLMPEPLCRRTLVQIPDLTDDALRFLQSTSVPRLGDAAKAELVSREVVTVGEQARDGGQFGTLAASLGSVFPYDESHRQRYEQLRQTDVESVKRSLDWYNVEGSEAYQVLAERDDISRETVRQDLLSGSSGFATTQTGDWTRRVGSTSPNCSAKDSMSTRGSFCGRSRPRRLPPWHFNRRRKTRPSPERT